MPNARSARRALRTGATLSLVGLLAVHHGAVGRRPTRTRSTPRRARSTRPRRRSPRTAGKVSSLDAQYAAASARLDARCRTGRGRRRGLQRGPVRARPAHRRDGRRQEARRRRPRRSPTPPASQVRRYAASVYQQGGSLGELEAYLSSTGPQDLMDRATALEAVSDARARTLQQAAATSIVADTMRSRPPRPRPRRPRPPRPPRRPATPPRRRPTQAAGRRRPDPAAAERAHRQLATLRKTSVDLEKQRQDGLAAAAVARAAAAEAARQARLAAERAKAARTAAARKAARAGGRPGRRRGGPPEGGRRGRREGRRSSRRQPAAPSRKPKPRAQATTPPPPPPSTNGGVVGGHRLRAGPDRQAVPVGRRRPEQLRLLRPDDARLAAGRREPLALHRRPVGRDRPGGDQRPAARRPRLLRQLGPDQPPRGALHRRRPDDRGPLHRRQRPLRLDLPLRPASPTAAVPDRREPRRRAPATRRPGHRLETSGLRAERSPGCCRGARRSARALTRSGAWPPTSARR